MWVEMEGKLYFILVGFGNSIFIENSVKTEKGKSPKITNKIKEESDILNEPQQNLMSVFLNQDTDEKQTKIDVIGLGLSLKDILVTTKIKISQNLFNFIEKMIKKIPEERPSIDDCINFLLNFCEKSKFETLDIYHSLSSQTLFKIPHFCDVELVREILNSVNQSLSEMEKSSRSLISSKDHSPNRNSPRSSLQNISIIKNRSQDLSGFAEHSSHSLSEDKDQLIQAQQQLIKEKEEIIKQKDLKIEELLKEIESLKNK